MRTFYVGFIDISPATAQKIQSKHGVTPDEVRELLTMIVPGTWNDDPVRGRRLYVSFTTSGGRRLKVVLQPVDVSDGTWKLAQPLSRDDPNGHHADMARENEPFDAPDDDLDEVDLTEDEFDARAAAGEPVMVIGLAVASRLHTRLEDYYTLQMSHARAVATSAGRWGGDLQPLVDQQARLVSRA